MVNHMNQCSVDVTPRTAHSVAPGLSAWLRIGFCLVAILLAAPATAYGQVGLKFGVTLGQNQQALNNATILNPRFGIGFPTSKGIRVNVEWGLATADVTEVTDTGEQVARRETRFLNPYVDVAYRLTARRQSFTFSFGVSLGMTFPVADADTVAQSGVYQVALSSAGLWNPWLYLPDTLGFTLPMQIDLDFGDFVLWVDSAVFLLVPTDNTAERSTQFGPQVGIEGFVPVRLFDLGARFQLVQVGDNGANEGRVHTSFVPLVRLNINPVTVEARFNVNLGTAGGTPFGAAGTWGATFGLSIRI